jgi:hypothetical protein
MSKTAWLLVLLLIGSNVVWLLLANDDDPVVQRGADTASQPPGPAAPPPATEPAQAPPATQPEPAEEDPVEPPPMEPPARAKPSPTQAWKLAQPWIDAVRQTADPERRATARAEMRAALGGDDPLRKLTALSALSRLGGVQFDTTGLRGPILKCVEEADDPFATKTALYALYHADREPEDLDRVIGMLGTKDWKQRSNLAGLVVAFADKQVTGKVADAVLELLADRNARVLKSTLNALERATVSPAVETRLLELAQTKEYRLYTIRFALSRLMVKSDRVVEALLAATRDGDAKLHRWAVRGLREGAPAADRGRIVAAALDLFRRNTNPAVQIDCLRTVRDVGDAKVLPQLEKMADDRAVAENVRDEARAVIAALTPPPKDDGGGE